MKNRHPKRKMALKMQTKEERKITGIWGSPFESKAYSARREGIKNKLKKKI